jgi:hypothetical protein
VPNIHRYLNTIIASCLSMLSFIIN